MNNSTSQPRLGWLVWSVCKCVCALVRFFLFLKTTKTGRFQFHRVKAPLKTNLKTKRQKNISIAHVCVN